MALFQKVKQGAVLWLARRLPTCKETTEMLSQSLDRPLSLYERINLKLHLLICVWCERYKNQLSFIREALQHHTGLDDVSEASPAMSLSTDARERIKRALIRQDP